MKSKLFTLIAIMSIVAALLMGSAALANNSNFEESKVNTVAEESSVNTNPVTEESLANEGLAADEANELKFRNNFGLEKNQYIVKEKIKKYKSGKYGVHLSPEEELEIDKRFEFQETTIPAIKQKLQKKTNGDYIIYIDQANGGIINIGLKNTDIDLTDIKALFPDEKKLKVIKVDKSNKDLDEIHNMIWNSRESLESIGITINDVSTDVINQKIRVGVLDLTEQKEKQLVEKYGDIIEVREANLATDDANRASTWNPMQAGAKISYSYGGTNYRCSVGFMATDGLNKYIITAGHCRPSISTYFYQGTTNLGQMPFKNQSGNSDAGAIGGGPSSVTYQGGKIYYDGINNGQYTTTQNASEDVVGEGVCMSGASTDTNPVRCGTITSTNISVTVEGYSFTKLRSANYTSAGGDSGGIVYNGNKLKGVNKGTLSNGDAMYSHLQYVLTDLSNAAGKPINILF